MRSMKKKVLIIIISIIIAVTITAILVAKVQNNYNDKKAFEGKYTLESVTANDLTLEEKIAQIVQESVYKQYADLEGIVPKFFKNQNETDKYHAVFEKSNVIGKKIVSVSFGKNGQIKSIKESK